MPSTYSSPPTTDLPAETALRIEADTLDRLERIALTKGVPVHQALHEALQAGTCHLERENATRRQLTPKQQQVMECLKSGLSVKEAGAFLGISEETVRTHILRIRGRLDCSDLLSLRFR